MHGKGDDVDSDTEQVFLSRNPYNTSTRTEVSGQYECVQTRFRREVGQENELCEWLGGAGKTDLGALGQPLTLLR